MKRLEAPQLVRILANPSCTIEFNDRDWDSTIRQARAAGMLATVHQLLLDAELLAAIPERPRIHLEAADRIATRHREVIEWEVHELNSLMEHIGVPMIALKGAAYVMADLEAAKGRMFGDIDIMVPRGALSDVERALGRAGWVQESQNAYDDRYYRQWMHEIPARRHVTRGTVLDVHHNILPLTARNKPSAQDLWKSTVILDGFQDLYVFPPEDMLLHNASHLFCNGEFDRGLRDLYDFFRLACEFSIDPSFWSKLSKRAQTLDLIEPLGYAVHYANLLFDASIPIDQIAHRLPTGIKLMDALFNRGLTPQHSTVQDIWTPAALFALYVRGHYMRMPFRLLLPHLIYKATLAKRHEEAIRTESEKKLERFRQFLGTK